MARYGYGAVTPVQFVGFLGYLSQGAWATVGMRPEGTGDTVFEEVRVLPFFKRVLGDAIHAVVLAQGGANDATAAGPAWVLAERRFCAAVDLLVLDGDPAIMQAAKRVRDVLCDGATDVVRRSADAKVDFGRNQLAVAATDDIAPLVAKLGLRDRLDDVRKCTDDLDGARNDEDGRTSRSRRIVQATVACAAAFNWVHEGLQIASQRATNALERESIDALIAPLEQLLARRAVTANEDTEESGSEGGGEGTPEPGALDPTG
jgi:hypothetical protein